MSRMSFRRLTASGRPIIVDVGMLREEPALEWGLSIADEHDVDWVSVDRIPPQLTDHAGMSCGGYVECRDVRSRRLLASCRASDYVDAYRPREGR